MRAAPRSKAVAARPRTSARRSVAALDAAPAGSADPPPSECPASAPRLRAWGCPPGAPAAADTALQQRLLHARPVLLQPVFELGHRARHRRPLRPCSRPPADTRASGCRVRPRLHQPRGPPLSFARMSPRQTSAPRRCALGLPARAPRLGHRLPALLLHRLRFEILRLLAVFVVRPFGSRRLLWPRLTSDDAIPTPLDRR